MKKFTPIIQFYFKLNFLFTEEGKESIFENGADNTFKIVLPDHFAQIIKAIKGQIIQSDNQFQLLMPIDYIENDIEFNALPFLPDHLIFYIQYLDPIKYAYSGIPQQTVLDSAIYLTPQATKEGYIFNKKNISAFPCCSTGKQVSISDSVQLIYANYTLADYIRLINVPELDFHNELFEFIINGDSIKTVLNYKGPAKLNLKLKTLLNTIATIQIKDHSGTLLSTSFTKCFITEYKLEKNIIGIIDIPKSKLILDKKEFKDYENINQFMLHFPNIETELKVILNTDNFEGTDTFNIEGTTPTLTIKDHPDLENFKQISFNIENYLFYLNKQNLIKWVKKKQIISLPFDPILNYNSKENNSSITITKQNP